MSKLGELKSAADLSDVARLLGFKPSGLSYVLYQKKKAGLANYTTFKIPKRSGGERTICAPTPDLKLIQKNLATLLQDCVDEINTNHGYSDSIAHGFKRGRSTITNATRHRRRRFVFNIDLHDFFGTINFGRVRGFFCKEKNFSLNEQVATVLAQIACFEDKLPQGSPCSPVISNLVAHILDVSLVNLASRHGCTYTRYADDLTFSTNALEFPEAIAKCLDEESHLWAVGSKLQSLIGKAGFLINPGKTRMQYRRSRQDVTGLVVNRKINTKAEYRHLVRAMVHRLIRTGSFNRPESAASNKPVATAQLRGMLAFIHKLDLHNKALSTENQCATKADNSSRSYSSRERTYRQFLLFTECYATSRPLLVGEGPTDYIYLRHAVRGVAKFYPQLATVNQDASVSLKVKIFRHNGSTTERIMGIDGGTSHLREFMLAYHEEKKKFSAPEPKHPVIVVVDNDAGTEPVYGAIRKLGKMPSPAAAAAASFIHVTGNLYVVATPLRPGDKQSKMEDFFDQKWKDVKLNGKSFDDTNSTNSETRYGKMYFATRVVEPNASSIDFVPFRPLLDRIVEVIEHHEQKVANAAAVGPPPAPKKDRSSGGAAGKKKRVKQT